MAPNFQEQLLPINETSCLRNFIVHLLILIRHHFLITVSKLDPVYPV